MDQNATAEVLPVGLQADHPGPGEGAGLGNVLHPDRAPPGHGDAGQAWRTITAGGPQFPTLSV